jgi:hypothetical protein
MCLFFFAIETNDIDQCFIRILLFLQFQCRQIAQPLINILYFFYKQAITNFIRAFVESVNKIHLFTNN